MVLTFENRNYIYIYEEYLEKKTTTKSIGDIHPTNYIRKTTDKFGRLNFSWHKTSHRESNIVIHARSKLHGELYAENIQKYFCGMHGTS